MKINPVWRKELVVTMRSIKFPLTLAISLGIISALVILVFDGLLTQVKFYGNLTSLTALYFITTLIEFVIIGLIAPTLTAPAICGEKERGTLDILLSTKMSPRSIILGKLWASLSKVILLIIASTPIFAITLSLGGVSISNIFEMILLYIATAIFCGSVGLFFSSFCKSTKGSIASTYVFLSVLAFGTIIITLIYYNILVNKYALLGKSLDPVIPVWLYFNPGLGYGSIIYNQLGASTNSILPFGQIVGIEKAWIVNLILEGIMTIVMLFAATYMLNPLRKRRIKK
ncbi:ABC transporter permease [Clostridium paridis]|uniref:ABC transporter permease subunit n=1 Tax=Clostridium paridis TaxID=2803863 RepID=A0A937FFZ2_9CLOT|nr:ABC transporter permease subunit [Clostridium paridis]MBL4932483.1 ABC transporter permease subunit [Clostridium paridis]